MVPKVTDDEIPEMIEDCIQWASNNGKDDSFFLALQEWYDDKEFLTDRQYKALCEWHEKTVY